MPGTAVGNFEARGDTDWFRVYVEEGKTYTISTSDYSVVLSLALPDGTTVNPPVAYTNQITFVATHTGDYWVSATNTGDPNFFSFSVVEETAPNPANTSTNLTLGVGETASGTSYSPDDWYAVELVAGQSYLLSSELTSRLYLSDADGNLVTLADHQLHFTPTVSGTYYAGVHFSGAFSVKLEEVSDDHGTSAATAGTIQIGAATAGVWEAGGDSDWYAISLTAGNSYSFSLATGDVSIRPFQIYDPSGQLVVQDTSGAAQPTIIFSPATSGTYYIAATKTDDYYTPLGSWAYSVAAELVPGDVLGNKLTGGVLALGTVKNGTWEETADSDWYAVTLTAGQSYSFDLTGTGQDIDVTLYDASGNQLAQSYNGPYDSFARLGYTAVTSGTYYIGVSSNGHLGSATYRLTPTTYTDDFSGNSLTAGTVTVGGAAAAGTIQAPGDSDWFAVQLSASVSYVFSSDVATLVLRDGQGNALTAINWGDNHYTPSASGTYYVEAMGMEGDSYSVSIGQVQDDYRQDPLSTGVVRSQTVGTASNDKFVSSAGHEYFSGQGGDDRFVAGAGYDQYFGGAGIDTVSFAAFGSGVTVRLWQGGLLENGALRIQIGSMENVEGTAFADVIEGNSVSNILSGGNGSDTLKGLAGNDSLIGGAGDDVVDGGDGIDTAGYGDAQAAVAVDLRKAGAQITGAGTDTLVNIENVDGSAFGDTIRGNDAANGLAGVDGADKLYGYGGDDTVDGGNGDDYLYGLDGNDTLTGGSGYDRMYGGVGDDIYYVTDATDFTYELIGEGADRVVATIDHQLRDHVENLTLTGSAVIGKGNVLGNQISGNAGLNKLYGYDGNDVIDGGAGDDHVSGGNGNDTLTGGAGYDKLYGGLGDDTFIVTDATDFAYENAGEGRDKVIASVDHRLRDHIEELELTGTADIRGYGNAENNLITGNGGANLLYGRDGHDTLRGEAGNDLLYGENGNDRLDGGAGQDRYYGGAGADQFIFDDGDFAGPTPDRIMDFSQLEGDLIDLGAVDANSALAGDQGFSFVGSNAFTGTAGQLRTFQAGGMTYLQGDTNGDGAADFLIRIDGLHNLQGSDFII